MLTNRELAALSGKNSPEEDYDNYRREHNIPYTPKPVPERFLISPEAVEHDTREAYNKYLVKNPDADHWAFFYGYFNAAYRSLYRKYQELLNKSCNCQQPRNGD